MPDSQVKSGLVWYLYGGSVFIPTYEEYLCSGFILAYIELLRLLVWGGPCPVASSRSCTHGELVEHFCYHTVYLGVAAWMHSYTHGDRRRDFARLLQRRRPASAPQEPSLAPSAGS